MANPNPTKIVNFTDNPKPPAAGKGRPKGAKNKTSVALREAIILAAENEGQDGNGKDGLAGYLRNLAKTQPTTFATLLAKLIPAQIDASVESREPVSKEQRDAAVAAAMRADR